MVNKSSLMLALLLIANPFVLLFFQNCSTSVMKLNKPSTASKESIQAENKAKPTEKN